MHGQSTGIEATGESPRRWAALSCCTCSTQDGSEFGTTTDDVTSPLHLGLAGAPRRSHGAAREAPSDRALTGPVSVVVLGVALGLRACARAAATG